MSMVYAGVTVLIKHQREVGSIHVIVSSLIQSHFNKIKVFGHTFV